MNTVCIFSHDCPKLSTAQRSVQSTDMTDGGGGESPTGTLSQ